MADSSEGIQIGCCEMHDRSPSTLHSRPLCRQVDEMIDARGRNVRCELYLVVAYSTQDASTLFQIWYSVDTNLARALSLSLFPLSRNSLPSTPAAPSRQELAFNKWPYIGEGGDQISSRNLSGGSRLFQCPLAIYGGAEEQELPDLYRGVPWSTDLG